MTATQVTSRSGQSKPGDRVGVTDLLVHPVVVVSAVGLLVNDYWAKRQAPSWLTGKASDALGAILLTALGIALVTTVSRVIGQPVRLNRRLAASVATVVAVAVAMVKTSEVGAATGGVALGLVAWPLELLGAVVTGQPLHGPSPVGIVVDPFDAVAALAAFVVAMILTSRHSRSCSVSQPVAGPTSPPTHSGNDMSSPLVAQRDR